MNRRKFLTMLGLAPAAFAVANTAPVEAAPASVVDPLDEEYRNLCAALSQHREMPKLRKGGPIRPGPHYGLVGERGPEIFINTGADPREVIEIIKKYQQRGGGLT